MAEKLEEPCWEAAAAELEVASWAPRLRLGRVAASRGGVCAEIVPVEVVPVELVPGDGRRETGDGCSTRGGSGAGDGSSTPTQTAAVPLRRQLMSQMRLLTADRHPWLVMLGYCVRPTEYGACDTSVARRIDARRSDAVPV